MDKRCHSNKDLERILWKKYPKMFDDSSGTEMDVDIDTTMETESRPIVDREEKLKKVEEKLLSNKTYESFTNYDCVMSDDKLSLPQKVIHLQKGIDDSTRRKTYYASLQGQLLEKGFLQSKKVYKETLKEMKITRQWLIFYKRYINSFSTTVNFNFALFPYVFSL